MTSIGVTYGVTAAALSRHTLNGSGERFPDQCTKLTGA
jgi:hypothetical protein